MTEDHILSDQAQRSAVLSVTESFIVQAPAGSGKTELLTQRLLALLAHSVKTPEQILAITFTRKAAGEMRARIIKALAQAANIAAPVESHHAKRWQLAQQVLERDKQYHWKLMDNPNRLRIQTIDSLCSHIVKQLPILSGAGSALTPAEPSSHNLLYQQAVENLLTSINNNHHLQTVLRYLDNNITKVSTLLTQMLEKRDQWMPLLTPLYSQQQSSAIRVMLEQGLRTIAAEQIEELEQHSPDPQRFKTLCACLAYSHGVLYGNHHELHTTDNDLEKKYCFWKAIENLLLTKKKELRRAITKTCGFPTNSKDFATKAEQQYAKEMKQQMVAVLAEIGAQAQFIKVLQAFAEIPPIQYQQEEWSFIIALVNVLCQTAAELKLIFKAHNISDYIEIAQAADFALGRHDRPSDLALALDYKIQHILVDEFQDTSIAQFELLEKLISGWQAGDGHTLFIVGDPMQSIYRFRQAEVGLFLRAQRDGIANIPLRSLILQSNFRSTATVMDWINTTFTSIFPQKSNIANAAVCYSPSISEKDNRDSYVKFHTATDRIEESELVIKLLSQAVGKTAILVRGRSHLQEIVKQLQSNNIPYQASEIEKLSDQSIIKDLLQLTKALLHIGDTIAWLSILRAPWCGLTLDDLYLLRRQVDQDEKQTIYQSLFDQYKINQLSQDGQDRLLCTRGVLAKAIDNRCRLPLSEQVKQCWVKLNGLSCVENQTQQHQVEHYFDFLRKYEQENQSTTIDDITQALDRYYTPSPHLDPPLQLLTIHKAKGLEFDTVIIPGLSRKISASKSPVLHYLERPRKTQGEDLIIAPIKIIKNDSNSNPIYDYLKNKIQQRLDYETTRLLYVATTRAKTQLHLLADAEFLKHGENKRPDKQSMLSHLWPLFHQEFKRFDQQDINSDTAPSQATGKIKRLATSYFHPVAPLELSKLADKANREHNATPSYIDISQRYQQKIGTLTHAILQRLAEENSQDWHKQTLQSNWRCQLISMGIPSTDVEAALTLVNKAIDNSLNDSKGRWLLARHKEARSEFAVTQLEDNTYQHYIIDRTFVDEHNERWIIDYKISTQVYDDQNLFLQQQTAQYKAKLQRYYHTLQTLFNEQKIRCALYFPLQKLFHEVNISE
ncbi:MAG: UvrD-helicase domain-containing protein [Pseudomonadota bacterium]